MDEERIGDERRVSSSGGGKGGDSLVELREQERGAEGRPRGRIVDTRVLANRGSEELGATTMRLGKGGRELLGVTTPKLPGFGGRREGTVNRRIGGRPLRSTRHRPKEAKGVLGILRGLNGGSSLLPSFGLRSGYHVRCIGRGNAIGGGKILRRGILVAPLSVSGRGDLTIFLSLGTTPTLQAVM